MQRPWHGVLFAIAAAWASLATPLVTAQEASPPGDQSLVEPYTGPPIYLDQSDPPPPPTAVETSVKTEKYDDGSPRIERGVTKMSDDSFVADGIFREYYANKQRFVEGQYEAGEPTGEWVYYHENGKLAKKVSFVDGLPSGPIEIFRPDGTLAEKREFKAGVRSGEWVRFAEDGKQRLAEAHYKDGKPDGAWKAWHKSGQLLRETHFVDGQRDGEAREWNEDGSPLVVAQFKAGKRHGKTTQWLPNGEKVEREFADGKAVSSR